eukprot:CAMPEP_0115247712 /NCGR_PEP_ID=MMETSP0270-20121206/41695_1 /TAXON_ID=71861 /ORGANISM="Scrippsiella trochoidea, Strain CCMP3099" /LENGTH=343 /DNA_ID=CAMNT_0002662989 /DNA_START=51 /DNA_END=1083 /DNA_ORIENTATION=+
MYFGRASSSPLGAFPRRAMTPIQVRATRVPHDLNAALLGVRATSRGHRLAQLPLQHVCEGLLTHIQVGCDIFRTVQLRAAPDEEVPDARKRQAGIRSRVEPQGALVASEDHVLIDLAALRKRGQHRRVEGDVRQGLVRVEDDDAVQDLAGGHVHGPVGVHEPQKVDPRHPHQVTGYGVEEQHVQHNLVSAVVGQLLRQVTPADPPTAQPNKVDLDKNAGADEAVDVTLYHSALLTQPCGKQSPLHGKRDAAPLEADLVVPGAFACDCPDPSTGKTVPTHRRSKSAICVVIVSMGFAVPSMNTLSVATFPAPPAAPPAARDMTSARGAQSASCIHMHQGARSQL